MIKISYDGEGDILEIKFSESPIDSSEYIKESGLVIDYSKTGSIVAIEITSFSTRVGKDKLVETIATW